MTRTKDVAIAGAYLALLIGSQFALSWAAGVEVVTVLLAAYCYYFGVKRGVLLSNLFSLSRCLIYGFFPSVVVLYIIYYNLFSLAFGLLGAANKRRLSPARVGYATALATLMTVAFTLIDDVITPLMYGLSADAANAYFFSSLPVMLLQCACTLATMATLFYPVMRAFYSVCGAPRREINRAALI